MRPLLVGSAFEDCSGGLFGRVIGGFVGGWVVDKECSGCLAGLGVGGFVGGWVVDEEEVFLEEKAWLDDDIVKGLVTVIVDGDGT